jgi:hypothetical protein
MGLVVNATPRPLYPRERPSTRCRGWVCLRAGLDGCLKCRHHRDSIPSPSRRLMFLYPVSGHLTWMVAHWLYVSGPVIGKVKEFFAVTVGRKPCPDAVRNALGLNPGTFLNCSAEELCPGMPWVRPLTSLQF